MRYIGGKRYLLDNITAEIKKYTKSVNTIIDTFSGSGIVSSNFKEQGYNTQLSQQKSASKALIHAL